MKEERIIQELASLARKEAPPQVNVADRVMAILRTSRGEGRRTVVDPIAWVAAASAAVAIPVVLAAFPFGGSWGDTLMAVMAALADLPRWML